MKKRNIILGSTVAMSTLALLTACSSGSSTSSTSSVLSNLPKSRITVSASQPSWKSDTSKTEKTITWFVDASWWNPPMQSMVAKKIDQDLHVKIQYVAGDDTKLNTYFASGKMPDIVTLGGMNNPATTNAQKWALPLNKLAAKYDPYWNKVASQDTMNWYKLSDGNTYGYPGYSNTAADYKSGKIKPQEAFVIRKDVYEAIGKPAMDTPAKFVAAMKLIQEKFPDLSALGFGSTVGLTGTMQDLLGVPYYKDGKMYDRNLDSDYLKWMEAFREVHANGGISDDTFTLQDTNYKENISSGKYATLVLGSAINYSDNIDAWKTANANGEYIAVNGPKSTEGNSPVLNQAGISGWMPHYISKDAKDPQTAMEIFTYLQSSYGQMLTYYGTEGTTYTKNSDGTVQMTAEQKKENAADPTKYGQTWGIGQFYLFGHDKYKSLDPVDSYKPALTTIFDWGAGKLTPEFPTENVTTFTSGSVYGRNYTNITDEWNKDLVTAVRSKDTASFDAAIASYKAFAKSNGGDDLLKQENKTLQDNLKRLGYSSTSSTGDIK